MKTSPAIELKHIGLIAGQGDFPILLAKAARSNGTRVTVIAIKDFASPELEQCADEMFWVELGQVKRVIELLHENNVTSLALAGRVPHTSVLQYRHFDMRAVKMLAKAVNNKPDSLLGAVARELESEGITVLDSSLFLKTLMPKKGLLTMTRPLTAREAEDIEFGYPIAKVLAGNDIGQTIVVKEKMVIAVEGVEGTDECILRAGSLAGPGCVVVKVSKPNQDLRFDIPVIGLATIQSMKKAGCCALGISAEESLILGREAVLKIATQNGISIQAV